MFKKPKRNFRTRKAQEDCSDAENDDNKEEKMEIAGETYIVQETAEDDPVSVKKKKKKADKEKDKPVHKSSSVLSFHEEEEPEEVFKIKRSSHSRRVAKQLKKQSQQEKEQEKEMKAKKKELQRQRQQQQQNITANGAVNDTGNGAGAEGAGDDMELGSDFDPDEDLVKPEEDEGEDVDEDAERRRAFQNILESGVIPDAKMIHEARKRRQMARELGDFVPIDDTVKVEKSSSRLIREDDNDKSDSDDEPVSFSVNNREKELRNIQSTILAAQEESDNDQEKEWEEQQIRKGTSMPQVQDQPTQQTEYYDGYQQYMYNTQTHSIFNPTGPQYNAENFSGASSGPPIAPTNLGKRHGLQPSGDLPQVTIDQVKKRLKDRLESMVSVHRAHVHERDDMASRHEMSKTNIEKCTGSKGDLEEQYRFFQEMRGYVRDLVECLNEKVPQINYLERRVLQIEKARADYVIKRRQEDIKDQSADLMSNKAAAAPNLSGVDSPSAQQQDHQKQRRIAEREARRARRRRKREALNSRGHNEGMSTDDEENNSIIAKYKLEIETITNSCDTMFEDVMDDFHDLDQIKSRFEDWRNKHSESYNEAYIGLCLPKLFTPFVKLGLITWNPLQENSGKLDDTRWFESLMFYAFRMGDDSLSATDQDVKLVPSIVEKVVISKLISLVEQVWDPLSAKQTRRLVTTIQGLICDYPSVSADSKHVQNLVRATVTRIRKTLDDDVFMPLYSKDLLGNRSSGQYQFFQRQFWTCVKLLDNILAWHGILSDRVLRELALDGLLNRYVMLALMNSPPGMETVQKCAVICGAFPPAWFTDLQELSTIPQLENLCRYMVKMADNLDKSKSDTNRKEVRETIKQITKLLVNVHALDHASSLSKS